MTKTRRMRWARNITRQGKKRNIYRILVGKPEGRKPPGRTRRRLVEIIKMDFIKMGWGVMNRM
jgi:hypothetical protein